jgi:hypothetical protein
VKVHDLQIALNGSEGRLLDYGPGPGTCSLALERPCSIVCEATKSLISICITIDLRLCVVMSINDMYPSLQPGVVAAVLDCCTDTGGSIDMLRAHAFLSELASSSGNVACQDVPSSRDVLMDRGDTTATSCPHMLGESRRS